MNRTDFLHTLLISNMINSSSFASVLDNISVQKSDEALMPVLFIGHGSPMNAIQENIFTKGWQDIAKKLPIPHSILCISAHWETKGTFVTDFTNPPTIHDFGGFPKELFDVQYPANGSKWLVEETIKSSPKFNIESDTQWGLDHGAWSVLKKMYPDAKIPVNQLSIDYTKDTLYHYQLANELRKLRKKGVLIIASGNMVHNLRKISFQGNTYNDFNKPFGFDWALEANEKFKNLIVSGEHQKLIQYQTLGSSVALSIPSSEHFIPLIYTLGLQEKKDSIEIFNDYAVAGSITMTSLLLQ